MYNITIPKYSMSHNKNNTPPIAKNVYYDLVQFPVNSPSQSISFGEIPSELATDSQTHLKSSNFRIKEVYIVGNVYSGRDAGIIIEDKRNLSINLDLGKPAYQPFRFTKHPIDVVVYFIVKDDRGLSDEGSITFQITATESSPNLLSATIRGDQIALQFDDLLSDTLPRLNNFTLKKGSRELKLKDVEVIASDGRVNLISKKAVDPTETLTLDYFDLAYDQSQGVIQSKSGVDLPSFSSFQLNNQTTQENTLAIDDADFKGNTVILYLNAPIGSAVPSAKRFEVKVGRESQKIVGIDTDPSEGVVTLTTQKPVASFESIKVSYRDLNGDQTKSVIEDEFGNDMKTIRDYEIIGLDETPPKLVSADFEGNTINLYLDSPIGSAVPSAKRFEVKVGRESQKIVGIDTDPSEGVVTLTTQKPVASFESIKVSYRDLNGDQTKSVIEDEFGNDMKTIRDYEIIGLDETPPKLVSAELNDKILTMAFDSIVNNTKLSKNRFKVKVNGKNVLILSATVEQDDSYVDLALNPKNLRAIDINSTVTLAYKDPKGDQTSKVVEDIVGNDLDSFSGYGVEIVKI